MNSMATKLSVWPRIQDNEQCSSDIAAALTVLAQASTAVVVCDGYELVVTHGDSLEGCAKAKEFLEQHKSKQPKIPNSSWKVFENIVDHAHLAPKSSEKTAIKKEAPSVMTQASASTCSSVGPSASEVLQASPSPVVGVAIVKQEMAEGDIRYPSRRGLKRMRPKKS
jgi:hypothetical protein